MRRLLVTSVAIFPLISCAGEMPQDVLEKWEKTKIDIASITNMGSRFYQSLSNFKYNSDKYDADYEFIVGDLDHDISDTAIIHIVGNLNSNVTLGNHSELIVMGNVSKNTVITVDGIARIYIGGTHSGVIESNGSSVIYIKEHMRGSIHTGDPSTEIYIYGDLSGAIRPSSQVGSLASLNVYGYTDISTIKSIFGYKYTEFSAAFHYSNYKPGIYQYPIPNNKYYTIVNESL
jgi:hypothetical protein